MRLKVLNGDTWRRKSKRAELNLTRNPRRKSINSEILMADYAKKSDWETLDTALTATAIGLTLQDWAMTSEFAGKSKKQGGLEETNPLFNRRPSHEEVNTKIGLGIAAQIAAQVILPKTLRRAVNIGVIAGEYAAVKHNERHKVKGMSFSVGGKLKF